MYITRIEKGRGRRYKVYNDDRLVFALYYNELQKYHIEENTEIDDSVINTIENSVILKRAKERALYLLEKKMYTASMMYNKLMNSDYPEHIVEQVLSFLEKYHYLNDEQYVGMYVRDHVGRKSRRQLLQELSRRGVDRQIVDSFFEEFEYSEEQCFARQFEKYVYNKNLADFSVRQKIFRYFYGKGFSVDLIREYMQHIAEV